MLGILSKACSIDRIIIGLFALFCSYPIYGQGYTYAPVDSLAAMKLSQLDSLYPSAFSSDSSTNLSGISRSEFESAFIETVRPIIDELFNVGEKMDAPVRSTTYLLYFNTEGTIDHARLSIYLEEKNHPITIAYPDSTLDHLLSNLDLDITTNRPFSQCSSAYFTHDPTVTTIQGPKRYLLAYQPGKAQKVNGIAVGVIGHDVICNAPYNQTTNGINLQIGGGLFHWSKIPFGYLPPTLLNMGPKSITNGLQCSLFGTQTDLVNGAAVSGFVSVGEKLNGIAFNLGCSYYQELNGLSISFKNSVAQTKGIQLGIINSSNQMRGVQVGLRNNFQTTDQSVLQIGLWNTINGKSFPILNFRR